MLPSYLLGTLGHDAFDLSSYCHGQPTKFAVTNSATDIALGIVTLGIYTPHQLELRCGAAPRELAVRRR